MSHGKNSFLKKMALLSLLGLGAYGTVSALIGLGRTAVYVHESVTVSATVTNYTRRPFVSAKEALASGNLSMGGDPAYFPHVSFRFDNGIPISDFKLSTPDNEPCQLGERIEIRTYPYNPGQEAQAQWRPEGVRPNKAALLWGGDALLLLFSLALAGLSWLKIKKARKKNKAGKPAKAAKPAPGKKSSTKSKRQAAPRKQAPAPAQEEEPFSLTSDPAPAKKKRSPRKPKAANGDTAGTPPPANTPKKRTRKKKS